MNGKWGRKEKSLSPSSSYSIWTGGIKIIIILILVQTYIMYTKFEITN